MTLAVDAQPEVVDRQMGFVFGLMEYDQQLGACDAEASFSTAGLQKQSVLSEIPAAFARSSTSR